jgi:transcription antitermination factor NusG
MRCFWQNPPRVHPFTACLLTVLFTLTLAGPGYVYAQGKPASASGDAQIAKTVGTIKSIEADSITVATESAGEGEISARLTSSTKILRVPPGEKDLKNATALESQDLQIGDRVLVRGQASTAGDKHSIVALSVIVMKQADVAAKQQRDREDWQKRGVGGLVTNVDAATGTITISSSEMGANRSITVHLTKDTILRRYAPGSVRFDDAKPAPASQVMTRIKAGDQLRARGTRSADGSEVSAEEVVSGAFRNIAGTIKAIDPASNTMTVQDAIGKSAVVVKVTSDSQMKKLPAEMAQRIAMRLKGPAGGGNGDQPGANGQSYGKSVKDQGGAPEASRARTSKSTEGQAASVPGGGQSGNGPPDLQRMLSRLPNSTLADLEKGDAVMIVSTEGTDSGPVTAITLLGGVDAILTASPNQSASTLLSPWSLNASGGEGEAAQ